jgi:hypothetical protein
MTMSAAQEEAINELSAMCEARGWLTPRDQMVHLFSHHQCDMICEENGLLWNKACSCGVIIDVRRGGYIQHLIAVLNKESGHEAVSFDVRGQVQAGNRASAKKRFLATIEKVGTILLRFNDSTRILAPIRDFGGEVSITSCVKQ